MLYQIVDNVLSPDDLLRIKHIMLSDQQISWFYSSSVATKDDKECFYFTFSKIIKLTAIILIS